MQLNPSEISDLIKTRIEGLKAGADAKNTGTVISVTDGICRIHGLSGVMQGEMLEFPGNTFGLALNLERDSVGAGTLPVAELRGALSSWQTGSGGSEKDLVALMSAVEVDQFNNVEYAPLAAYAFRILSHMQSFS